VSSLTKHPFRIWYDAKSRGGFPLPEDCPAGRLEIKAWNAAIEHAEKCIVIDGNPAIAFREINELRYPAND